MDTIMDNYTNSTEFEDFVPYSARIETYLVPILFTIIFVSGIVGNSIVCIIFVRHPSMRNVPNTYVNKLSSEMSFPRDKQFYRIGYLFLISLSRRVKMWKSFWFMSQNNTINGIFCDTCQRMEFVFEKWARKKVKAYSVWIMEIRALKLSDV